MGTNYSALAAATKDDIAKFQALSNALDQGADDAQLRDLIKQQRKAHKAFRQAIEAAGFAAPAGSPDK
jgi:aspartate aminotransferase-like enzyme